MTTILIVTEIERLTKIICCCLLIILSTSCVKNSVRTDKQLIDKFFQGEERPVRKGYDGFGDSVPVAPDYYYRYEPTTPVPVMVSPPRGYIPRGQPVNSPVNESDQYYVPPQMPNNPDIYHEEGLGYIYLNESH